MSKEQKLEFTISKQPMVQNEFGAYALDIYNLPKRLMSVLTIWLKEEVPNEDELEIINMVLAAPALLDALEVCYASLCTYGSHLIIDKQVELAIKKAKGL